MLCPVCYGRRLVVIQGRLVPCPECAGQGEMHCCEGLQEQPPAPEPTEKDKLPEKDKN